MLENKEELLNTESVAQIRVLFRERQKCYRQQKKDDLLSVNRTSLTDVENTFKDIRLEEVKELAQKLKKKKDPAILHQICSAACLGNEHIEEFLKFDGALGVLVGILCCNDPEKQLDAAACITNLACGSHKSTQKIAKAAGAYLVSYIKSGSCFLQDQCSWAAGNIASDCAECSLILNAQGLLPALQSLLHSSNPEVLQSACFSLNMATKYETPELLDILQSGLTASLLCALNQPAITHAALVHAMFALSNISHLVCQLLPIEQQIEVCEEVLTKLSHAILNADLDILIATAAVRCLGGLSTGSEDMCKFITVHRNFGNCISAIMKLQQHYLKKELTWVLSNLLVSCAPSDCSIDWFQIVETVKSFLSPLDSGSVQAIYFLCVLLTKEKAFAAYYRETGIVKQIETLRADSKEDVATMAQRFCSLLVTAETK